MLIDTAGNLLTTTHKREIRITDPRLARMAANADDLFRLLHLTVVCVHCGSGVRAANHPSDTEWVMECECATRKLVNPDRRSH